MNSFLILIIGIPVLEILLMIELGGIIGGLSTVLLIIATAVIGLFFARIQGLSVLQSGLINIYKNKVPVYELIPGASIAVAAFFLIFPGFMTDTIGFLLLIPLTRRIIISIVFRKNIEKKQNQKENIIEAEIIEEDKKKDDI